MCVDIYHSHSWFSERGAWDEKQKAEFENELSKRIAAAQQSWEETVNINITDVDEPKCNEEEEKGNSSRCSASEVNFGLIS